jgi:UDP-N-acetyl-D-glucosamine dehydrogenase
MDFTTSTISTSPESFYGIVKSNFMKLINSNSVAVIGQGYVGLPLALEAAKAGWNVIGVEKSETRCMSINSGKSPIEGVEDHQIIKYLNIGRYICVGEMSLISNCSVIILCLPTPLSKTHKPDLTYLIDGVTEAAKYISSGALVISESTSYPGTLRELIKPLILKNWAIDNPQPYFAAAPERVNPGDLVWNLKNTPRVVGGIDQESTTKAIDFYRSFCDTVIEVSSPEIAEASKLLENTFRQVNIALVNELTQVFSSAGLDINSIINAASSKPYGFFPFKPGVGVGGHCIPIDPIYLASWAKNFGIETTLIERADVINNNMPNFVGDKAIKLLGENLERQRVLIIGVTYKSGVSDLRETPILKLIHFLRSKKVEVAWYDPLVKIWGVETSVTLDWQCDLIIVAQSVNDIEMTKIISKSTKILDCTNSVPDNDKLYRL